MNERIRMIRKSLELNQQEFADELGVSKSIVQSWESGRRSVGASSLYMICDKYNINQKWLETGVGPMKIPEPNRDEEARVIAELSENLDDPVCMIVREAMAEYIKLDRVDREKVKKYAIAVLERLKNHNGVD